jgi:TonB dependent receptor
VQRAPGGGFLAVNISGQRRTANNYMVDGISNNDRYYGDSALNQTGVVGIPATLVPMDAIAEFTVQQTPSAEFGTKGGAAINVVMKSGTNTLHGSAHLFYADDFANSANFFTKSTGPEGCTGSACGEKTPFENKQFGATLGGPIVKDKTFFFAYYEGQRLSVISPYTAPVPTPGEIAQARARIAAAGLRPSPIGENLLEFYPTDPSGEVSVRAPTEADMDTFSLKLDHRVNRSNQLSLRYFYGTSDQSAPATVGELVPPDSSGLQPDAFNSVAKPSRVHLAGLTWTSTFANNKVWETRVGFTRFGQVLGEQTNKVDPKSLGLDTGPLDTLDFGVPAVYMGYFGYIGGIAGYPITTDPNANWDVSSSLTWTTGRHNLKFGGNFQHAYTYSVRNRARTAITAAGGGTFDNVDSLVGLLLARFDDVGRSFGSTVRNLRQNNFALFVNDEWKPSPRFTLSLGVRYDYTAALGEKDSLGANFFPDRGLVQIGQGIDSLYASDKNNIGPRVGFAWDIGGNGRTALRGGYSLTYDIPNFGSIHAPRTTWSGMGARAGAFTQPNLDVFSVTLIGDQSVPPDDPSATCFDTSTGAGDYVCGVPGEPLYGPNPSGSPPFNVFAVDPELQTPMYHLFHVTLQREVFRNNVATVSYVGSRGRDLLMYRDLNAPPVGGGPRPFASRYPDFGHIIQLTNDSKSWYDSLQVSWRQQNWRGINTQYNLTWGNCRDYASINRGNRTNFSQAQNPYDPSDTKGPCDFDIRLNFNVGGTYKIPDIGQGPLGTGWEFGTVFTALSGRRFTPGLSSRDRTGQGIGAIRANCSSTPIEYNPRDPSNYIGNAAAVFSDPPPNTLGTCGRNSIEGPGLAQWDLSLIKMTNLGDRVKMQFRWEVFNVLNRANFDGASANYNVRAGSFGDLTSTPDVGAFNPVIAQGGPRAMQFAIKLLF